MARAQIRLCVASSGRQSPGLCGQPVQGERLDRPEHPKSCPARRLGAATIRLWSASSRRSSRDRPHRRRPDHGFDLFEIEAALEDPKPMEQCLPVRVRRSWLHATAPSSVRWRAGRRETRFPAAAGGRRVDRGSRSARATRPERPPVRCRAGGHPAGGRSRRSPRGRRPAPSRHGRPGRDRRTVPSLRRPTGDGDFVFPCDPEGSTTGDEDPSPRRRLNDRRDILCRVEEVLDVVQDQHHRPVGQEGQHGRRRRALRTVEDPDAMRDRRPDLSGRSRSKANEPGPVRESRFEATGHLDREARLADPAWAGERHQPRIRASSTRSAMSGHVPRTT